MDVLTDPAWASMAGRYERRIKQLEAELAFMAAERDYLLASDDPKWIKRLNSIEAAARGYLEVDDYSTAEFAIERRGALLEALK